MIDFTHIQFRTPSSMRIDGAGETAVRRPHPVNALTAVRVRSLKKPGQYADGNGLYLVVVPSGLDAEPAIGDD